MLDNSSDSSNIQFDYSHLYRTQIKISKYIVSIVPSVDVEGGDANTNKFITGPNTFEFTYGDQIQVGAEVWNPQQIMQNVLSNAFYQCYYFVGINQTEPSDEPYYGYVTLNSPHIAWKLDGINYTSDPLVITYYIHPAEA